MKKIKEIFNYDNINDAHKEAAEEIVDILKSAGAELQAELIKKKFKLVEPVRYNLKESEILKKMSDLKIPVTVQGWVKEGDIEYQIINAVADIRKWEEFWKINCKDENN